MIDVLRGSRGEKVLQRGHDKLPTFGVCKGVPAGLLGNYIDQLIDDELLVRSNGEYPTLALGVSAMDVLRGTTQAVLRMPKQALAARGKRRRRDDGERGAPARDLTAAEQGLFETLRQLRRAIANEMSVPPFVVFSDATLDELARSRPTTPAAFLKVKGVGQKKLESFGARFLAAIAQHGERHGVEATAAAPREPVATPDIAHEDGPVRAAARAEAAALFRAGTGIDDCVSQLGRAMSTVVGYLVEWIAQERPASIAPWVAPALQARVEQAMRDSEDGRLKPVFEALGGDVPYEVLRIVGAHLRAGATGA